MGLLSALRLTGAVVDPPVTRDLLEASAAVAAGSSRVGIRSPWSTGTLAKVMVSKDIFGDSDLGPVARASAMTIPAVVKGVGLVTSSLSQCPWVEYEVDQAVADQPAWLYSTAGQVAPQYRTGFVVEDLVLYGWSVLTVERGADENITAADRLRPDLWEFDEIGNVVVDDQALDPSSYILVKGPTDGILNTGVTTLRAAINLELAWSRAVKSPMAATVIQQVGDDQLDDDEIDDILADWRAARQDPDGAVAFLPSSLKAEALGEITPNLLIEARNAVAVDIARLILTPAVSLDAGAVQTSLTYSNTEVGNGLTLPLYGLKPYADCIGAALSMDSVCKPGRRIALDMTQLMSDAASISRSGTPTKD